MMEQMPLGKNRDFRLLMAGRTVSLVGGSMTSVALLLLTMDITGSAGLAAAVSAVNFVSNLLTSLFVGTLVDRWDRKRVMVVSSLVLAAVLVSAPVASLFAPVSFWHLMAVSVAVGTLGMFYGPAEAASIKRIVPPEQLGSAMAVQQVRWSISSLLGGPLAGALYAFGRFIPLVGDALANVIAALFAGAVRSDLRPVDRPPSHVLQDTASGLRWLWGMRGARMVAIVSGLSMFAVFGLITSVTLGLRADGQSATVVGLVQTVVGAGLFLGSVSTPWLQRRASLGQIFLMTCVVQVVVGVALLWSSDPLPTLIVFGLFALTGPPGAIGLQAWFMAATPERLQGRASAALNIVTMGLVPPATLMSGWLLDRTGRTGSMVPFVITLILVLVVGAGSSALRSLPRVEELSDVARAAEGEAELSRQLE